MEDPGAGARGLEEHRGAAPQLSDGGVAAVAATPGPGGGLLVDFGAREARLFTSEEAGKGLDPAVGSGDPLEAASASLEGRMCKAKGSSSEERSMGMEEEKGGSLPFAPPAELGGLQTIRAASCGFSDKALHALSSRAGCSKDGSCINATLDKATEGSPSERADLRGNCTGDWRDVAEVKTFMEDFDMASEDANHYYEGSLDSMKPGSEQWPHGVNGLETLPDTNSVAQQNDLVPNIEAEICKPLHADSDPSVSGSVDVSVDGKTAQFHKKSSNPVTSHATDGGLRNINCGCDPAGCVCDRMGMVTEGSVSSGGVDAKISLNNLEIHCNGLNLSVCKSSGPGSVNGTQQISQKCGIPESSSEIDLHSSYELQRQCDGEPCFSGREPSSLCLGQDSGVGGFSSVEFNTCNSADNKTDSVDFVSNGNDTESQTQQVSTVLVFRRRNPKRAASSRNLRSEKPDQIKNASNGSPRPKKGDIAESLYQITISPYPKNIKRGRSDLNRPHKSSAWGSLEKVLYNFSQGDGPLISNSHPIHLENEMSSKRPAQMNVSNIWKCRGSRSSKNRCSTFSDMRHLTDELNERHAYSAIVNTDPSLGSCRQVVSKVASDTSEFTDGANTQHLKRDLACSTQEICAAEIHGECAKLSTSGPPPLKNDSGAGMLPIGFSPDSVLEVASVTCESNASASHDVMLHENSPDADYKGCGHDSVFLPNSYLGRNEAPSVNPLEQQAKIAGMSENMKREQTNSSHTMMNSDASKGDVQTLQKSKPTRKTSVDRKKGSKKKDRTTEKTLKSRSSTQISSFEASKPDANLPDSSELPAYKEHSELDSGFEVQTSTQDHGNTHSCSVTDNGKVSAFHTMKSKSPKQKKDGNAGKKGKVQNSHVKGKGKKQNIEDGDGTSLDRGLFNLRSTAPATVHTKEQSDPSPTELAFINSGIASTDLSGNGVCKTDEASVTAAETSCAAWVCCDDCQKWRCIPSELANAIGEDRWTCKDNEDKAFADCSIPQEKSNAEINAELGISDDEADACKEPSRGSLKKQEPSWAHIKLNLFLHRNRRTQSIDESMVCNCKPPQDGRMGCRDGCLNRMLNIECVKRTCPCGEQCSNQQFQRRNYAKLKYFHSGKKGYGLQLQEDVSEGRFLIEYVGEVLDIASYELRQQQYALKGQKHFYFMALNGGEVIDACSKGNLGRFINHSCTPNCRTEKWMVNGEVCIGIFAMRDIKKGEELTFDYNYVRVSSAAPQKCFCGTAKCRGYIGGDISIVDTIDQDDTEAGHFADTIVHKDSKELMGANGSDTHGTNPDVAKTEFSIHREDLNDLLSANAELEPLKQIGGTLLDASDPENSLDAWCPQEDEDVIRTPVHVSRTIGSTSQHFPVHGIQSSDCLRQTPCATENLKAPKIVNGRAPGSDFGGNRVPGSNANKRNNLKDHRNVKQSSPIDNEHSLGVEGRLNNLLDRDGGISKRKDATNGYLKLLFLTAAEGDSSGGTSKSVRDLSLILDALLKTKSRAVLLDIINKNGLQMLHNILKQNRSNFHRIPILRKLLKVLEFLALKEILTTEHINGGPRCAGVESFRDSMMCLTRHNDMQVHQIARNFRDRWIPRYTTRSDPKEYPRTSTSAQDFRGNNMVWNSTGRKRKSRWDYQPDEHYKMVGLKFQKAYCGRGSFDVIRPIGNKMQGHQGANKYQSDVHDIVNSIESTDDEVPPGFESLQEHRSVQAIDCEVAPGICMERYQPSLTISYGIPIALVRHIGTPAAEGQCDQNWKVAPGVPFIPFPPLPPYPRGSPCPSTSTQISQHDGSPNMKHNSSGHYGRKQDREGRVHRTCRDGSRTSLPYSNGKRFPSNHHRFERFQPSRPQ